MTHPQVYHWVWLILCIAIGIFGGVHDLVEGVDPEDARFYHIARIVNPLLALGLVMFSILIALRQFWAIDALVGCFVLSITYHLLILRPVSEGNPVVKRLGASRTMRLWTIF
jgi:hypothetical protein